MNLVVGWANKFRMGGRRGSGLEREALAVGVGGITGSGLPRASLAAGWATDIKG